ncbi:hypothetical protein [Exiguobacterium sp. s146]|uniref:hypothetical protein n=1 Tax=Exiguobacterium sp. s146 TaxID=2751223 RepID=UPI001BE60911|nr:hypothetical protein [Exiguobacterium sp. s146]
MDFLFVSLFSLLAMIVPLALLITAIVMVLKFMKRHEQRAHVRLELERQAAADQRQQFAVLMERLDRIEEKVEAMK